jgi:hypothetical protein
MPSHLFKEFTMSKKPVVVSLLVAALGLSALVFSRQQRVSAAEAAPAAVQNERPQTPAQPPVGDAIPDHVTYDVLFRQIAAFKNKAGDVDARGGNGDSLRQLVYQEAGLSAADAEKVDKIQGEYMRLVGSMDGRARKIIEESRLRNPTGKLAEGAQLPEPPQELKTLQNKRNNLTLRARAQVRAALGEEGFRHFAAFVKEHIARKLKPVEVHGRRPLTLGDNNQETPRN